MKTTDKVISILFDIVKESPLAAMISGSVRKLNRPAASEKEDVVINCLPINNEDLQRCVANVNIYVPCYKIQENQTQTAEPDFKRLEQLTPVLTELFSGVRKTNDYQIEWEQQQIFKDPDSDSYIINVRLRFQAFNLK